ncbi:MAG: tetratricopeptide repeat protein, partial [Bacteroidota bacterium]
MRSLAWIAQGKAHCFVEQYDSAQQYVQLATQLLDSKPDSLAWGELFITKYLIAKRQGKFIEAQDYIEQAIAYFEGPAQEINRQITALIHQGNLFNHLHRYSEARQAFMQAKGMAEKQEVLTYLPALFNGLGISYLQQGNYPSALASFLKLLTITDHSQLVTRASAYGNIGHIYRELDQLDSARVYAENTLSLYRQLQLNTQQSDALVNLAAITRRQGNLAESEAYLAEASSLLQNQNDPSRRGFILIHKGLVQRGWQRWDQAATYLLEAAHILHLAQQHASEMIAYVYLAQVRLDQDRVSDALSLCQKVESSELELDEKTYLTYLHTRIKALTSIGKYKEALLYQNQLISHKDSLEQAKLDLITSNLLQDLAYKKQNQALIQLQKHTNLKEQELSSQAALVEKQRWQIGVSLAAILVGGILLALLLSSQREKTKALEEQAKLSVKLEQQRDRLSQENQNKDLLLSILSHDLRSPLALIKETLDMYEDQRLTLAESQAMV